jgi:hypothetical protein
MAAFEVIIYGRFWVIAEAGHEKNVFFSCSRNMRASTASPERLSGGTSEEVVDGREDGILLAAGQALNPESAPAAPGPCGWACAAGRSPAACRSVEAPKPTHRGRRRIAGPSLR